MPAKQASAANLKFSEMNNADRWDAYNQLRKERLISSFGDLRALVLPEDEVDELIDSPEEFEDVLYRWCNARGYLKHLVISPSGVSGR